MDQAYLLPPNIKDVLGKEHLCFHVHRVVEALDVSRFEQAYGAEGRLAYPPRMMLKVWLYAFCLRLTSTRRLEQRVREDLGLRYLAGGLTPDHKTLSEFCGSTGGPSTTCSLRCWSWRGEPGWCAWDMWPSIRRG